MINLLPPDSAKQLRAARHNATLLRFVIANGIVLGLIVVVYIITFGLMKATEISSVASSTENQQRIASLQETEKTAKEYTENLKLAKSIFDSELSHTTALRKIASALPAGTVLTSLTLDSATAGQPTTLVVLAKNQAAALAVKQNLEEAAIAKDITIANITTETASTTEGTPANEYPVSISLNLTYDQSIFKQAEQSDE